MLQALVWEFCLTQGGLLGCSRLHFCMAAHRVTVVEQSQRLQQQRWFTRTTSTIETCPSVCVYDFMPVSITGPPVAVIEDKGHCAVCRCFEWLFTFSDGCRDKQRCAPPSPLSNFCRNHKYQAFYWQGNTYVDIVAHCLLSCACRYKHAQVVQIIGHCFVISHSYLVFTIVLHRHWFGFFSGRATKR